jgi:hypothetical protein
MKNHTEPINMKCRVTVVKKGWFGSVALGGLVVNVLATGPKFRGVQTRPRKIDF